MIVGRLYIQALGGPLDSVWPKRVTNRGVLPVEAIDQLDQQHPLFWHRVVPGQECVQFAPGIPPSVLDMKAAFALVPMVFVLVSKQELKKKNTEKID